MEASGAERERDQQQQRDGGEGAEEKRDERRGGDDAEQRDQREEAKAERSGEDHEDKAAEDEQSEQDEEREDHGESAEDEEESKPFISLKGLNWGEPAGMLAALALFGSLFLPWFSTSETNPNSKIISAGIGPGETATAWQTFPILKWALVAGCAAPFILTWIVARGHKLSWKPGEVTMLVGMTAFVLILCNGIILGKPKSTTTAAIDVSLQWGYPIALLAAAGVLVAGFLRQSLAADVQKPPGVF